MRFKYWIGVGASIILGLIFATAGLGKLLHQAEAYKLFFFPDFLTLSLAKFVFIWFPRIELIIGLLLVVGMATKLVTVFSSVLIAGFITNNVWLLIQGLGDKPCGCFGVAERMAQAHTGRLERDLPHFDQPHADRRPGPRQETRQSCQRRVCP